MSQSLERGAIMTRAQPHLLRLLSNHEYKWEIVHAEGEIEELVRVAEEDDIFDGILRSLGVFRCQRRRSCQRRDFRDQHATPHTFELDQKVERIFVRRRAFPDVSSQDRVRIVEQFALLEVLSHEVTDRIDLV